MINFETINVDGKPVKWEFNTVEEILVEWWTNDGLCLPAAEDIVVDGKYIENGKECSARTFEDILFSLEIDYWQSVKIGYRS